MRFAETWRLQLESLPNLDMYQESVSGLMIENDRIVGVRTTLGLEIRSRSVVITAGTFLNGQIHIGNQTFGGGRAGENSSKGITEDLVKFGFESGRMKTGTPPRVDGRSLDYSKMIEQPGDEVPYKFSYLPSTKPLVEQRSCYMTYTSTSVHEVLREGFEDSPMFSGRIQGIGPRYCPSIEDKIDRFASKERHQIFVEPEGWDTYEVYVNGFSTSLPYEVQSKALKLIEGFENVNILRFGYAIEYDYFPPTQLKHTLETKLIENLYFAGQINGTTGYEEAAAQGLMAGINAVLKLQQRGSFILQRDEAYIGVLIDDLITKGTEEPYRMFTSRAEYRTLLRQDNADIRLTPISYAIGLASKERYERVIKKQENTDILINFLQQTSIRPQEVNTLLAEVESAPIQQSMKMYKIAARPQLSFKDVESFPKVKEFIDENGFDEEVLEQAEIHIKYAGYIEKEKNNADKLSRLENIKIPDDFDYHRIKSMSFEAREKLSKIRPISISQAARISGVSPSDISILLVYMGR
jgi:tRNA uridine 5-carboxymethylaminomethyl modification enzyme